jgi:hypothetical protein
VSRLPVEFFDPTAKEQLLDLPSKELKRRALELLAQVSKVNPTLGKPCGFAFSTGNLSDCRKLYFDEKRDVDPRYRIIYRLLPDEDGPSKAEVIRIGLKVPYGGGEEQIYRQVGRALDRLLGRDRL